MKRQIVFVVLACAIVSLLGIEKAFAGAWTVPKHKVWAEYYMKWSSSTHRFNEDWSREGKDNGARSWEYVMEPKLEYGITDWLNFQFGLEYKDAHYKEYDRPFANGSFVRKNHDITNIKFGGKLRFLENPFVVSTQTKFFVYPGYGIYHGDDPAFTNQPGLGNGDDAFEQRIQIGKSFEIPFSANFKLPCYAGAETGYRFRTKGVSNDIPYFLEAGFWPVSWFLVKSEIDGYKNSGTGRVKESYGIWRIGGVWQAFGNSALRKGNKLFNIEFQYGVTLWGKNTDASQEVVLKTQTQF